MERMNSDNPYGFHQNSTNIVEYQGEIRKPALFWIAKKINKNKSIQWHVTWTQFDMEYFDSLETN